MGAATLGDLLGPGVRAYNRGCGICGAVPEVRIYDEDYGVTFSIRCHRDEHRITFTHQDFQADRYSKLAVVAWPAFPIGP